MRTTDRGGNDPAEGVYERVVRSHRHVRAFLAAIDASARGDRDADWRGALAALGPVLPAHFAAEEEAGGFCDVVARHVGPDRARTLRREHHELLRWIDALAVLDGRRHETAARAFAERLAAHERAEAELALRCERIAGAAVRAGA